MPINKNQLFRYRLLDACLSDRNNVYSIKNIMDFCNRELQKNGFSGISMRTLRYDLNVIETEYAEIERYKGAREGDEETTCYRYKDSGFSIPWTTEEDEKVRELRRNINKLQSIVAKLDDFEFEGAPIFDWISELRLRIDDSVNNASDPIVVFETGNLDVNKLKFLNVIYKAIIEHKSLIVCGYSFRLKEAYEKIVSPYMLKQYNCRWYLICKVHHSDTELECLPLDRINSISVSTAKYKIYKDNVNEFYEDVIGVTVYKNAVPELMKLRVSDGVLPYLLTRPLHGSQRQDKNNPNIITLNLIVNYELKSKIRSYGSAVEVLEPQSLRDEFVSECIQLLSIYSEK